MNELERKIYRVLDANSNRAREGLRVCEDIARFLLDNGRLARAFKQRRHQVTELMTTLPRPYSTLLACRDSGTDCGRRKQYSEFKRVDISAVVVKNCKRAEEAVRVIEEFMKVLAAPKAPIAQELRFSLYELEKKIITYL